MARAFALYGVDFPLFSDDPLEDWLVREALMARWYLIVERHAAERREEEEMEAAREAARGALKGDGWQAT